VARLLRGRGKNAHVADYTSLDIHVLIWGSVQFITCRSYITSVARSRGLGRFVLQGNSAKFGNMPSKKRGRIQGLGWG
jgi:hypothetical protein